MRPALAAVFAALAAAPAGADGHGHKVVAAESLTFQPAPPFLPKGAEFAVLAGDPARPGPYVVRLRLPSGYVLAPHWHSEAEYVTVIAGKLHIGAGGGTLERGKAEGLGVGGFFMMPARMPHYGFAEGETLVDVHSVGPVDVHYVNPEDDPRRAPR